MTVADECRSLDWTSVMHVVHEMNCTEVKHNKYTLSNCQNISKGKVSMSDNLAPWQRQTMAKLQDGPEI